MARAFWKGVISFGLVAIPIRMYTAIKSAGVSFHYLHKKDLTPPKQVLYCPRDNEYFGVKDTVKGYEYAKGQYLVFKESDFDKVPVRTTHAIEIRGFTDPAQIDPIYYQGSHYLEPEEVGVKPFTLLREALARTNRVGIAKVTFQRREHLCSLRPLEDIMVLHTLHYPSEIRPHEKLGVPAPELKADEMDMAIKLVEAMSRDFKPGEYRDEYREALEAMVKAKLEGQEIKLIPPPTVEIPDLMAALRQSIEAAQREKEPVAR